LASTISREDIMAVIGASSSAVAGSIPAQDGSARCNFRLIHRPLPTKSASAKA
jgi:hypothetical protein